MLDLLSRTRLPRLPFLFLSGTARNWKEALVKRVNWFQLPKEGEKKVYFTLLGYTTLHQESNQLMSLSRLSVHKM